MEEGRGGQGQGVWWGTGYTCLGGGGRSSPHCFLAHPSHAHTTHCNSLHEPGIITTKVRSSASWKLSGLCLKLA